VFSNGDRHHGAFRNGLPNGPGIYYFQTGKFKGDRFEGEFVNGSRHGRGTYHSATGGSFAVNYDNNKRTVDNELLVAIV